MTSYASSIKGSSETLIHEGENNGNWRKGLTLGNCATTDYWGRQEKRLSWEHEN